jgi:O-antigen/teichoic acid export membrane protein
VVAVTSVFLVLGWGLSIEDFGLYTFAYSLASLVGILSEVGLGSWTTAYMPRKPENLGELIGDVISLRSFLVIPYIGILIVILLLMGLPHENVNVVLALGLSLGLFGIAQQEACVCTALERSELSAILSLVGSCSTVCAIAVWWLAFRGDLLWFCQLSVISQVPAAVTGLFLIRRKAFHFTIKAGLGSWWSILRRSYLFALVSLVATGGGLIETVMLKSLHVANQQIGLYQMAMKLALFACLPTAALIEAFRPVLARRNVGPKDRLTAGIHTFHKLQFALASFPLVFMAIFSQRILHLLFGDKYLDAAPITTLAAIAFIIAYLPPSWTVLDAMGWQRYTLLIMVIRTSSAVFLNFMAIPLYGVTGVVTVTIVVNCVTRFCTSRLYKKVGVTAIRSSFDFVRISAVLVFVGLASYMTDMIIGFVAASIVFVVLVAIGMYTIGLGKQDREIMSGLLRRRIA